jgi:hypothetical protein
MPTVANTPAATPTCTPTATPYPAPVLREPVDGGNGTGSVLLQWQWDAELVKDQHFAVRVWRVEEEQTCSALHESVTWTKDRSYRYAIEGRGWHCWNIAVVRSVEPPLGGGQDWALVIQTETWRFYGLPKRPKAAPT